MPSARTSTGHRSWRSWASGPDATWAGPWPSSSNCGWTRGRWGRRRLVGAWPSGGPRRPDRATPPWPGSSVLGPHRAAIPGGELLDHLVADVVVVLDRRRFHEVGRRPEQGPADAPIEGELGAPDRVDDHPGRVGGVPHLELELEIQGHVAE